jgi:hypothetical protein
MSKTLAIPAGSPQSRNINDLAKSETGRFPNEIKCQEFANVSLSASDDEGLNPLTSITAPTGIGSGDKTEKHSGAFEGNSYHSGEPAATIAGRWYRENRDTCPRPVVPALRSMFGLTALQAVHAIREANGGAS